MIKQKHSRQSWWPLYMLALFMIGILFLAHRMVPSPGWRTLLQIGVVVGGYGLIALWLEITSSASLVQPPTETDHLVSQGPEWEILPPSPAHVRYQFYVDSVPVIIVGGPEQSNDYRGSNGYHPARTIPSPPEKEEKRR